MPNTFPKTERLTSKKLINRLFDRNARGPAAPLSVYAYPFRVLFVMADDTQAASAAEAPEQTPAAALPQVLFSVPKRTFKKAVDRNLMRRRCREAYRLNKRILQEQTAFVYPAAITFLYTAKTKISFDEIDKGMKLVLKRMMSDKR